MNGFVYKITNKVSGKVYVGKTKLSLDERWKHHVMSAKRIRAATAITRAIRKYSSENFSVEYLEEVSTMDLAKRETFWILSLKSMAPNGYNLTAGGDGFTGDFFSQETLAKVTENSKQMWKKPGFKIATISKIKIARSSPESRARTSTASKLMWADEAHRKRRSEGIRKTWQDPETKENLANARIALRRLSTPQELNDAIARRLRPDFRCGHPMDFENGYVLHGKVYCRTCRLAIRRRKNE